MNDPRLGDLIRYDCHEASEGDIVLVGVPTDEGIKRNGGRIGAAQAPDAIRTYLKKLTPFAIFESPIDLYRYRIFDLGNIAGSSLEEVHANAQELAKEYSSKGCVVVGLGGGHDVTYPLASGIKDGIGQRLGLINVDAHLDVREKKNGLHHSGSSFRLLIEDRVIDTKEFVEFGIQPFAAAKEHIDWVNSQGGTIEFFDILASEPPIVRFEKVLSTISSDLYLSFDIDSIRSSDAPGCSAPSPIGFTAEEALAFCYLAGKTPSLRAFDIVEVNPLFDIDGHTARLAARMIATLIAGIASRS